ncbi:hypothetical protein [Streptomyces minutiscleroticus]|uniref:Uncharacterized protein n=1 Tax=Streptomyces minutiscleroticus TaxID=68238 RepID=A0A918NRW5_9ACTN|nr:hypothetical protein [Streptomyces minutiscleroticus]GGX90919.1 hypothetical protein GCM10010358_51150 [Streptomyces minutiscleroticus]
MSEESILKSVPAGGPYGSWPAEQYAAQRRAMGEDVRVVMDLERDAFLVVRHSSEEERAAA